MYYYEVAPLKIVRAEHATFTYHSADPAAVGDFVTIPIGKRTMTGIIISTASRPNYETKELQRLAIPALPPQLVHTSVWMSDYYQTHLATVLQTVLPRGITKKRRQGSSSSSVVSRDRTKIVFNSAQQHAIKTLTDMSPGSALIHGITGSGKTAVYIEMVRQSLDAGRSAIILVPEIALTSQLVADITQHFPVVHLTHSRQTEAERHATWLAVANSSEPSVIIGPRSGLFMPIARLGLIVIDEAHEPSFKQEQAPRYSALRVASVLASQHQAKVIYGTATPLVSEYYLALQSGRPVIEMNEKARTDTVAPTVHTVDMTKRSQFHRHRFFSDELLSSIEQTLQSGNQVLIFHNRRGSASTTLCESCGWSAMCERCFVPLTLHADRHELQCHICGLKTRVPTSCPMCHSADIIHKGIGTKLIESELRKLFPATTIARFDGDTVDGDTVEQRYQEIYDGKLSILVGTQVLAKGLDLPHLRTVGVVQADAGLSLPDYTASERTFQLLAQVVGRVGRSVHPTSVIVQSYQPTATAVQTGIAQDYTAFYAETIALRQKAGFPPFRYLLKLTCVYKTEAAAIRNATALAGQLRRLSPSLEILGPTPAFYERQHDTYRWQIVAKSRRRADLIALIPHIPPTHWQIDLDPQSLL